LALAFEISKQSSYRDGGFGNAKLASACQTWTV
jgi:hypothetical protein